MNAINIQGSNPLYGEMPVHGSKNAILPILAACILTDEQVIIHNAPKITDIDDMLYIMSDLGVSSSREGRTLYIDCSNISSHKISNEHVGKIRSSVVLLGSVLARFSKGILAHPGGCDIGARPIDMHLSAFRCMGVDVKYSEDCWLCDANRLSGADIHLPFPSVGATENIILAAAMARGTTVIHNAAREPEINALQDFINLMGGNISGAGTSIIQIEGKKQYHSCEYTLIPDRIVAGTYMLATCACGGDVCVKNAVASHNKALIECLSQMGANVTMSGSNEIRIRKTRRLSAQEFTQTKPFPGFATDLQPQLMAVLCTAKGKSIIKENIYESRFKAALSLCELGADIEIKISDSDRYAIINGVDLLSGTQIYGTDLRCNAALIIAGLGALGETVIHNAHFTDRGYENIIECLQGVGAQINAI